MGSHLKDEIKEKIVNHKYVDFAKPLTKDHRDENNQKIIMINKGGYS